MESVLWIIGIVVVGVVIWVICALVSAGEDTKKLRDHLQRTSGVSGTEVLTSARTGLLIDAKFEAIHLAWFDQDRQIRSKEYAYGEIVAVEVLENGSTVTETNRGSQLAGAAIGGLALGGVGAIVGGLSGSKKSTTKVRTLSLKITVEDAVRPTHTIVIADGFDLDVSSGGYRLMRENVDRWHGKLQVAIHKAAEARHVETLSTAHAGASASVADELSKLSALRDEGILSDSEFEEQKRKLLSQ